MFTENTVSALQINERRDCGVVRVVELGMEAEWGMIDAGDAGEAICCTLTTVHVLVS